MKDLSKIIAVLLFGIFSLFIFVSGANSELPPGDPGETNVICELKVDEADEDENEYEHGSEHESEYGEHGSDVPLYDERVAKSLHFEMYSTAPGLSDLWLSLFGVTPDMSPDDIVILQAPTRTLIWEEGVLEMGGVMKIKIKTDKKNPALKEIKIEKAGKKEGTTLFISGTGGVNPNLDNTGWHSVKIEKMDNVTVYFDGNMMTGFLKELDVKLDEEGSAAARVVKEFKLKIKGATSVPDVKKDTVSSVVVEVPETIITAFEGTEYEEKIKGSPSALSGHTEAEYERESDAVEEAVDILTLLDGNNDQLKERKGPCLVMDGDVQPPICEPLPFEICGNGIDDDCNGLVDDGCAPPICEPLPFEICGNGIDDDCNGLVDDGCGAPPAEPPPPGGGGV